MTSASAAVGQSVLDLVRSDSSTRPACAPARRNRRGEPRWDSVRNPARVLRCRRAGLRDDRRDRQPAIHRLNPPPARDTARAMDERDAAMIDALRRTYEAFNRGDFDAAVEIAHPEAEMVPVGGQASLRGAAAVRAWMEPDAFEEQRIEPLDFRVEGNKVLARQHTQARGVGSGINLDQEIWTVWTFDDDLLVTRMESFLPHEESAALEALGLSK